MTAALPSDQKPLDVRAKVKEFEDHLRGIADIFNTHAQDHGLGVRVDAEAAIQAVKNRGNVSRAMRFCDRPDDSGVLHDAQLMTALDCVGELLTAPQNNGVVVGAMQSGKTTTSLALQFAGPIVYLLTGRCLYPIYLITSHTSQEDQTKIEISRFLDFYGELAVVLDEKQRCTLIEYARKAIIDPVFEYSPTITTYREHVLKNALPDTMMGPRLDDFIQRRVSGESIGRVAAMCRRANGKGFAPLLIIDEPQFGASDRAVKVEDGVEWRSCVLAQIFDKIDEALGANAGDRVFIGLSATPYELHDINSVWKVNQYLTSAYSGFNYFGGKVIDSEVSVSPPATMSFGEFGTKIKIPFLGDVSLAAYDANAAAFKRFAQKIGYQKSQDEYRRAVERTLREAILWMAKNGTSPDCGICIRLFNNNLRSQRLLQSLRLSSGQIDVIEYFGSDHRGHSVKRVIRQRARPDLPFLIAVTNRARMGDAFPRQVEWFLEFSKKASDLNALLQGLLGRACGYGKRSTIVMSQENADLVEDYKRQQGGYIYKTSRHSIIAGPYRRGAPTNLIRIRRDMDDPLVAKFFARLDAEVVRPHLIQGKPALSTRRAKGDDALGYRTGPVLRIATELGLFEHLEKQAIRERLFPTYPGFRIARASDEVRNQRNGAILKYTLAPNGDNRFTFREWENGTNNHGGIRSRGYGGRDASDRNAAGNTLEPQVNMRKLDPANGNPINDKRFNGYQVHRRDRRPGNWRAEMVTLPLVSAVRELQAGQATYPVPHSPFARDMNPDERIRAGFAAE